MRDHRRGFLLDVRGLQHEEIGLYLVDHTFSSRQQLPELIVFGLVGRRREAVLTFEDEIVDPGKPCAVTFVLHLDVCAEDDHRGRLSADGRGR